MITQKAIVCDALAFCSSLATIAAWQEQVDWAFKILASLVAIAAGCYSIYLHRQRIKRTGRP